MSIYLLVDIGSTYTKILAVDLAEETILGRAQSPTTIETDVTIGLNKALAELVDTCGLDLARVDGQVRQQQRGGRPEDGGHRPGARVDAGSGRAGPAWGPGAKLVCGYGFEIDREIVEAIEAAKCDIILLCGGTDGGDKKTITHNARMLAHSTVDCPILVAGNRVVADVVREILERQGKKVYRASNVLPRLDTVEVEPAQELIREIFIAHITKAKGLDKAADFIGGPIIPTPKATLQAAALLADGTDGEPGIGSLLVLEVGGATTNVHSVMDQSLVTPQTVLRGLPELAGQADRRGRPGHQVQRAAPSTIFVGRDAFLAGAARVSTQRSTSRRSTRTRTSTSSPRTSGTCPRPSSSSTPTSCWPSPRPPSPSSATPARSGRSSRSSGRSWCSRARTCSRSRTSSAPVAYSGTACTRRGSCAPRSSARKRRGV